MLKYNRVSPANTVNMNDQPLLSIIFSNTLKICSSSSIICAKFVKNFVKFKSYIYSPFLTCTVAPAKTDGKFGIPVILKFFE